LYKASCKQQGRKSVDEDLHKLILETYANVLSEVLVNEGHVTLCGTVLKIVIAREKAITVNKKVSKIYKTKVYNLNEHTYGYMASVQWDDFGLKKKKNFVFKRSEFTAEKISKRLMSDPKHILTYQLKKR
jgi:hypothetical protein